MTAHETVTGVVARVVNTGEADRYLTLLTAELGRVECYAKGVRSQKSKLAAHAGLLTFGEFKFFRKGDRRMLLSAKGVERFAGLHTDIAKYAYAIHFLEIARDVVMDEQPFPEALQTLLNSLFLLSYKDDAPDFVARVYELRMLALSGFAPVLERCSVCGGPLPAAGPFLFDAQGYGLVCGAEGCPGPRRAGGKTVPVGEGAVQAMRHVSECEPEALFAFKLGWRAQRELGRAVPPFLSTHFGREYEKLREAERYIRFAQETYQRLVESQ